MHCCALIRLQSLLCLAQSTKPLRIKKTGDLEFLAKTILWNRPKNIYFFFMALLFGFLISQQQCARNFVNLQIYQPTVAKYGNVYFCRVIGKALKIMLHSSGLPWVSFIHKIDYQLALSPTRYQNRTRQFLKVLHVYSIDNFVAF